MPSKFKSLLYLGCAFSVIAPGVAYAQEDAAGEEIPAEDEVSVQNRVLVTAQRREQSILDVPVAVTTISAEALGDYEIDNIIDIVTTNPSVTGVVLSSPLTNTNIRIRGIGTSGANAGFESAVGMYVDDVYRSRPGLALTSFFDMKGVEILRGPQGTLFGKNTTAGALVQRTMEPQLGETSGYATVEVANVNSYELEGAINIPLADNAALRVSGMIDNTDGFITNTTTNDDSAAFHEISAVRAQLAFETSEDLRFRVIGDYSNWETGAQYQRSGIVEDPNIDPFDYNVGTSFPSNNTVKQLGLAGYVDYDVNDNVSIRSITSYREVDSDNLDGDFDFGPDLLAGDLDEFQDMKTFSQEFIISAETEMSGRSVALTGGLHYFDEEIDFSRRNVQLADGFTQALFMEPAVSFQDPNHNQNEQSIGVFAHADIELSDQFSLIGGLRWTQVEKDNSYRNAAGTPEQVFDQAVAGSVANTVLFFLADGGLATVFPWSDSRKNDELTYDIALQWRPTDSIQAYAKYSKGFKAGGFNLTEDAAAGTPSPLPGTGTGGAGRGVPVVGSDGVTRTFAPLDVSLANFDPEFVDSYEVGTRWQFDNGLISVTGFWSDFSDLQTAVFTGLNFQVVNAGTTQTKGIEFEGQFDVTENLSVNAAATFQEATYGDGTDTIGVPRGRQVVHAPDQAITLGGSYKRPLSDNIMFHAAANVAWRSDEFVFVGLCQDAAGNDVVFDQCDPTIGDNRFAFSQNDPYAVVNGSIGLFFNESINVELFCQNCFSEEYFNWQFEQPVVGALYGDAADPRLWGARLRKDF